MSKWTMSVNAFKQSADIAQQFAIIKAAPKDGVYTTTYAQKAVDALKASGVDVAGASYKPQTVAITKGGE